MRANFRAAESVDEIKASVCADNPGGQSPLIFLFFLSFREILVEESNVQSVDSPVTVSIGCAFNNNLKHKCKVLLDFQTLENM